MKRGIIVLILILLIPFNLAIKNNLPQTVLTQPSNYHIINDNSPRFEWIVYDNDTQKAYRIQISTNLDLSNPIEETETSFQTFTIIKLNGDKTYYWHVRVFDGKDWGPWSETNIFTLDTTNKECNDGTDYWKCNSNLKYCYGGNLIDNCKYCGCNEGYICNNASMDAKCINITCIDGTKYSECNNHLFYCNNNGELIENCNKCGCNEGYCNSSGICVKSKTLVVIDQPQKTFLEKLAGFLRKIFNI